MNWTARMALGVAWVLAACSSSSDGAPHATPTPTPEEGCEGCPCFHSNRGCLTGLACNDETFDPPACVPESEFQHLHCVSTGPDSCGCYDVPGLHQESAGCGDPSNGREFVCCTTSTSWPESGGACACYAKDSLAAGATCTASETQVPMCKSGSVPTQSSSGGSGGTGGTTSTGGTTGTGGATECDPTVCNGITSSCSDGFCIYCTSACRATGCETVCS